VPGPRGPAPRCFNSNWFDYSTFPSKAPRPPSKVSIPTGSITVDGDEGCLNTLDRFQFQLVRLQLARRLPASLTATSFNSNWFDYSHDLHKRHNNWRKVSIPTGSITVKAAYVIAIIAAAFQFQLVRLQSTTLLLVMLRWWSFNSNWFDYSGDKCERLSFRQPVSIPTGSITVYHERLTGRPYLSFNSNWFDYSSRAFRSYNKNKLVSIPTGSITVERDLPSLRRNRKFQFQLVRLQSST